jgi:adenine-specific DNA-methyltransferase
MRGGSKRLRIITFKQSSVSGPKTINPGLVTTNNYLLYYVKNKALWRPNRVFVPTRRDDRYSKVIENADDSFQSWRLISLKDAFLKSHSLAVWDDAKRKFMDKLEERISQFVINNAHRVVRTARVAAKDVNESARTALEQSTKNANEVQRSVRPDKSDYFFLNGEQLIFYKTKTRSIDGVLRTASPLTNLWDDLLSNNLHNEGAVSFPNGKKPEALIKRCVELATNPGDLVLDSFAGSGTTGAVAHKMGRRWIMVELGEHCHTHIVPRLQKVIDGQDPGGVTQATSWAGGGGFRYYELAPTLLSTDRWGNLVINPEYDAGMLSAAMCKLEGFTYAPSETLWWQQGRSSECDFIYVTTQTLGPEQLEALSHEVGTDPGDPRSLLVCCGAYRGVTADQAAKAWPNLTLKKIPKMVKDRCEWGHDDYSLNVANLPMAQKKVDDTPAQNDLFGGDAA